MSLSGDKGVAQFKKSVKMGHPIKQRFFSFPKLLFGKCRHLEETYAE